jgi:flagellar biogenesis protein FliO
MELASQLISVAGVLSLLVAALWLLRCRGWARWRGAGAGGRRLRCLERVALGPHHSLHLIALDGRALLVACSPQGCAVLENAEAKMEAGK